MVFDPFSKALLDEIDKHVQKETAKERKKEGRYKARCPYCRRLVIKKYLIENGCFVCGWHGSDEEMEMAMVNGATSKTERYRIECPNCGRQVIKEQLAENGCYICGFKGKDGRNWKRCKTVIRIPATRIQEKHR